MRYTDRLTEAGIAPSVGSRGDSYGNALAESIIGLFKTEVIQRQGPWRHLEAVEFATLTWVDWFNTRRLLEPIGYVPPAEYEARYYEHLRGPATSDAARPAAVPEGILQPAPLGDRRSWGILGGRTSTAQGRIRPSSRIHRGALAGSHSPAISMTGRPPSARKTFFDGGVQNT